MLCSQFLAASFSLEHLCFHIVRAESGQRQKKQTLQLVLDQIEDRLVDGFLSRILRRNENTSTLEQWRRQSTCGSRTKTLPQYPLAGENAQYWRNSGQASDPLWIVSMTYFGLITLFCVPTGDNRNPQHSISSNARNSQRSSLPWTCGAVRREKRSICGLGRASHHVTNGNGHLRSFPYSARR